MNTAASAHRLLLASAIAFTSAAALCQVPAHAAGTSKEGRNRIFSCTLTRAGNADSDLLTASVRLEDKAIVPDAGAHRPVGLIAAVPMPRASAGKATESNAGFGVKDIDIIGFTDNDAATRPAAAELRELVDHV